MKVINEFRVCTDCISVIANDDTSGIDSVQEERHIRRSVHALGPNLCLGDIEKTETFYPFPCDCCEALPGERFHVVQLGEK